MNKELSTNRSYIRNINHSVPFQMLKKITPVQPGLNLLSRASLFLALAAPLSSVGATLKWVAPNPTTGNEGASFTAASSWVVVNPVTYVQTGGNQAPTSSDILVFDGSQTPNPQSRISAGSQTIGQLVIINNAAVELIAPTNGNGEGTLVISNLTGTDLSIEPNSSLLLRSTASTANRYVVLSLNSGATAAISGTVDFSGNSNLSVVPNRLLAASPNAVQFQNGSRFIARAVIGYPFGSTGTTSSGNNSTQDLATTAGSVVFNSGSIFEHRSGAEPFSDGVSPVTVFNAGSTYMYSGGTFSNKGQQYGNLQLLASVTVAGTINMTVLNDLTVTGSTANLNVVGTGTAAGTTIGGSVFINSNAALTAGALNFNPASASNVIFNGTAPQSIGGVGVGSGSSTLSFGSLARLVVNNTSGTTTGVTFLKPLTVAAGLTLNNGVLTTLPVDGVSNALTIPYNVNSNTDFLVTGGSTASFVNGPLTRSTSATASGQPNIVYPIGSVRAGTLAYRPVTFAPNQPSASTYTVQQFEGAPANRTFPSDGSIKRVSRIRYYTLTPGSGATFNNARITLNFGPDDQVDNSNFLRLAQAVGATWVNLGGNTSFTSTTPPYFSGTISSGQPFSGGGDFVLASTQLSQDAGNNPLPVTLTNFSVKRQGQSVAVNWATAVEKDNAYFEVLRSSDGKAFQSVGRVEGQGTTNSSTTYSFVDDYALPGLSYYQLRQVDADGTAKLSSIAVVSATDELQASFYPNPSNSTITLPAVSGVVEYRVYSLTGQVLLAGNAAGNSSIAVQSIPAGVYILELTAGGKRNVQRFARQQ
ncbi:T9SS type A sorting domain-containing protein [Hymenobacter sp. UYP22]|uniref:T9SS type A sorting domain-containing protein n=1 Tax=Hymenobacter sp. UYP22 TaxID=3156348 RepID=UPI003399167C